MTSWEGVFCGTLMFETALVRGVWREDTGQTTAKLPIEGREGEGLPSALEEEGDSARERIEVTVEEGAGATRVKIGIAASAVAAAAAGDDVVTAVLAGSSVGGGKDFSVEVSISWTSELGESTT